jgi:hypothetical protein
MDDAQKVRAIATHPVDAPFELRLAPGADAFCKPSAALLSLCALFYIRRVIGEGALALLPADPAGLLQPLANTLSRDASNPRGFI